MEQKDFNSQNIEQLPFDNNFDRDKKPQKFFVRDLDLDLEEATDILKKEYDRIANLEMFGITPHTNPTDIFTYSKSYSTHKSREYNAFQMYYPFLHDLYSAVVDMTREACEYYEIDYNSERWVCQSWFNINSRQKGGKLDWHDHVDDHLKVPAFHGYFSVNAEPSETHYNINGDIKINTNKNNRAILSMVGYQHAMGPWDWEGERITIAYDVFPMKMLDQRDFLMAIKEGRINPDIRWEQHYFPLPKIIN
jgi:hypothetical protein